jgi:hypothetical protein
MLGVLALLVNLVAAVALILGGSGWAAGRIAAGALSRRKRARAQNNPLLQDPRIAKLELVETLRCRMTMRASRSVDTAVEPVSGEAAADLVWSRSDARAAQEHRARLPAQVATLRADAGAIVLEGPWRVALGSTQGAQVRPGNSYALCPRLSAHEVLSAPDGRGVPRWEFRAPYVPTVPRSGWPVPVQVTPSFTPDADRHGLDLLVQWDTVVDDAGPGDPPALVAEEIESVQLDLPLDCGPVVRSTHTPGQLTTVARTDDAWRIRWQKPKIEKLSRGTHRFAVELASAVDESATVRGEITMTFTNTLSGFADVHVYAARGGRRRDGAASKVRTRVVLTFELSLAAIRYQDVRQVPDPSRDENPGPDGVLRRDSRTFTGAQPDQVLVTGLVEQLTASGCIVKSVVENQPRPGQRAGFQHRVWDLTGRAYRGVHPTDFRITITGEESVPGAEGKAETIVRLSVRGAYATPDMERHVVSRYDEMWSRIKTAVAASRTGADGRKIRSGEEPMATAARQVGDLSGVLLTVRTTLAELHGAADMPAHHAQRLDEEVVRIDDALEGGAP